MFFRRRVRIGIRPLALEWRSLPRIVRVRVLDPLLCIHAYAHFPIFEKYPLFPRPPFPPCFSAIAGGTPGHRGALASELAFNSAAGTAVMCPEIPCFAVEVLSPLIPTSWPVVHEVDTSHFRCIRGWRRQKESWSLMPCLTFGRPLKCRIRCRHESSERRAVLSFSCSTRRLECTPRFTPNVPRSKKTQRLSTPAHCARLETSSF